MTALVVNRGARTITGPAVPYDRSAFMGGRHYRFLPGWACFDAVPLLYEHDNAQRVGGVVVLTDTPEALHVVLRVARGRLGDWLLERTEVGALGLSPKFRPGRTRHSPDRLGELLVVSARLIELSLTAKPAFGWG